MRASIFISLIIFFFKVPDVPAFSIELSRSNPVKYARVNTLGPMGYWPADEGEGAVLLDRSENSNDAHVYNVPWENGLLNFHVNAYQWVEIGNVTNSLVGDFSIGGFIFSRNRSVSGTRDWGKGVFFSNSYIWDPYYRRGQWAGGDDGLVLFLDVDTGESLTKDLRVGSVAVDFGEVYYGNSTNITPALIFGSGDYSFDGLSDRRGFLPIDSSFVTLLPQTGKNSRFYAGLQIANLDSMQDPPVPLIYRYNLNNKGLQVCPATPGTADMGLVFTPYVIKADFLNGNNLIDHLQFENEDGSAAFYLNQFAAGQTARLLVKNGSDWYVSSSELTDVGSLSLNGFSETWVAYDPSTNQFLTVANPGAGVPGSALTDIQAFGVFMQGMNFSGISSWAAIFETTSFAASLVPSGTSGSSTSQPFGVFSGGEAVIGTDISGWEWQHVLYTYEKDAQIGRLYVDGNLVSQKENVSYQNNGNPILIGNDMSFWLQFCGGLDGSVHDLVLFDRALSRSEIQELAETTRFSVSPSPKNELIIQPVADSQSNRFFFMYEDGRRVSVDDFMSYSPEIRCQALEEIENGTEDLSKIELSWLTEMLHEWQTRRAAAALLVQTAAAQQVIQSAEPYLVGILQNSTLSQQERASAALALAELNAQTAVSQMVAELNSVVANEGARIPRVEDLFRNALIRALLDIGSTSTEAREILGAALAEPILNAVDLSQTYLSSVNALFQNGDYLDALELFKTVSEEIFFSSGEAEYGNELQAYTREWTEGDCHYQMTCEPIDYAEVERLGLTEWSHADSDYLRRVYIAKTDESGTVEKIPFLGDWFILDVAGSVDTYKLEGWTVTVDSGGYIHVMGGQHNFLDTSIYAPIVWEEAEASTDPDSPLYPSIGYWVSTAPGDIHSFKFVGHKNNPRNLSIPYGGGYNYMRFEKNPAGELYAFGRSYSYYVQGVGLHKYDPETQRWHGISGRTTEMLDAVLTEDPDWADFMIQPGGMPLGWLQNLSTYLNDPDDDRALLVWSWNPAHYNYCRDWYAVRFDQTGRLHVRQTIRGLDENGDSRAARVYAWSDDDGATFHRADGSLVKLPLTTNPASEYNAEMNRHMSYQWLDLWTSLLQEAGY